MGAGGAVWWEAKRRLGLSARVTGERLAGRPVVRYRDHWLVFRRHGIDGAYFRLVVACPRCGRAIMSRTHRIHRRRDLQVALGDLPRLPLGCEHCPSGLTAGSYRG